ncbi:hypothetical protein [Bdellovibrio sp. HCB-110]|uniref:hypothetical protein n=1 Tax=Bdellovibrio sp. HCB-110 TaxID=3391182 RepID=UPI0039B51F3C
MKLNPILRLTVFSILFVSLGCTKPMDKKITKDNYNELLEDIRKNASEEDWKKVQAITMMAKMGSLAGKTEMELLEGKSFNQIIDNIKKKNEADLKAAKDEEDKAEQLAQLFEVIEWRKSNKTDAYGITQSVILSLKLKNKMDKEMDAFEGSILVYDKLQNKLGEFLIKDTELLAAGAERKLSFNFSTIDFKNNVKEIYATNGKDLRFRFKPTRVLLKDGTTL